MKGIAFLPGILGAVITLGIFVPSQAQVTSDGTTNTTVNSTGNNFNILNGIQRGGNLFHSFGEFSIPTGGSATFENSSAIKNIINRVTGGNVSNIDGLIKANGSASVFLINPSGIVFGENARLDIGGSFLGTTAESILFEDGFEFSTVNAQTEPLLTISVPLGLQMGSNPGDITVNNNGHGLSASSPIERIIPPGLEVNSGNTLALIGRNVFSQGGFFGANSGHVELGAVGSNDLGSIVKLNPSSNGWRFDYGENSNLGEIKLKQKSFIDSSGDDSGSIDIVAKNISIEDGSIVLIQTQNSTGNNLDSNSINIKASKKFTIAGTREDGEFSTNITSETLGSGSGADIFIDAKNIFVSRGAQIETKSFGTGNAAKIVVNAIESINLKGFPLEPGNNSTIASLGFGSGDAGKINLTTKKLSIIDGASIFSTNFAGIGNGGNITINAQDSIQVIGLETDNIAFPSIISSNTISEGNGGNLTINTGRLLLQKGGRIDASTFSFGNAGNVAINASESVEVNGKVEDSINPSLIIASANVLDENIRASIGLPDKPSGDSGSVTVNTPELRVIDGGSVTVQNDGTGDGGTLNINGDRVLLTQAGSISASTLSGEGGEIYLNLGNNLILRQGSFISTEADGTGNGGNVTINSPIIAGFENSDIIANAVEGNGGNIDITTQGIFGLKFRDRLTPESDITASSDFGVNGTVEINNISIDPNSGLFELPTELTDPSKQIASTCSSNNQSSFVSTGRGGIPHNPKEYLDFNPIWSDIRDLSAFRQQRNNSTAENPQIPGQPAIVEATGMIRNENGVIEFVVLENTPLRNKQVSQCSGTNM